MGSLTRKRRRESSTSDDGRNLHGISASPPSRPPLQSLSDTSPQANGSLDKRRRLATAVQIITRSKPSQAVTNGTSQRRLAHASTPTANNAHSNRRTPRPFHNQFVPAWKRLGLTLRSQGANSQSNSLLARSASTFLQDSGDSRTNNRNATDESENLPSAGTTIITTPQAENAMSVVDSDDDGYSSTKSCIVVRTIPKSKPKPMPKPRSQTARFALHVAIPRRPTTSKLEPRSSTLSDARPLHSEQKQDLSVDDALQDEIDETMSRLKSSHAEIKREQFPSSRPRRTNKRVSYVELAIASDSDISHDPESDFAVSDGAQSTIESEGEDVQLSSLISEAPTSAQSAEVQSSGDEEAVPVGKPQKKPAKPQKKPAKPAGLPAQPKAGKGINLNLPPMSKIEDIFSDMASAALDLGLENQLKEFKGRSINVATMCSGTESPLIALQLLSKALEQQGKTPIAINHHFSAEIDIVKQVFIERNFAPALLFRDIRDFIPDDATEAITAYGASMPIPGDLDLLIAGFVCKDLSSLNSRKKGLEERGESGDTVLGIYSYAKRFRPRIILLENVQSESGTWQKLKTEWEKIGYEYTWVWLDSKNYYLPQTRQRTYMIAVDKKVFGKSSQQVVKDWEATIRRLQRQCSSPFEAFLSEDDSDQYGHVNRVSEVDWALCKLRYDNQRSKDRLGLRRPVSQWSESGIIRPPDFANRQWYQSQSTRVYDAIDIAHLQGSLEGYDSMHKMMVWDVSQNVERFKTSTGIAPCITPNGCDFVTSRQTALTGSQLLLLQGMPNSKLLFARESQKDRQDLAGNAMSTTVIGAAVVSALLCARKFLNRPVKSPSTSTLGPPQEQRLTYITPESMNSRMLMPVDTKDLNISELLRDAKRSSRLCNCEGAKQMSSSVIKICRDCGHTACTTCAGNPRHSYVDMVFQEPRILPNEFEQKWRARLPSRLRFKSFPVPQVLGRTKSSDYDWQAFRDRVREAKIDSQAFSIGKFQRMDNCWKVSYLSTQATLELHIAEKVEWRLFLNCPSSEPGNSLLRKTLEKPIARGFVHDSLLVPSWNVLVLKSQTFSLSISGSARKVSSWKSRLGLPDHTDETVPRTLHIGSNQSAPLGLLGEYRSLPQCGTAMSSLYAKQDENPIKLFLDSDPIGLGDSDSFVFSHDSRRLPFGESRIISARLTPTWRPWDVQSGRSFEVDATIPGIWEAANLTLTTDSLPVKVKLADPSAISRYSRGDCSQAITILDAELGTRLDIHDFSAYSWALEQARLLPGFSQWQDLDTECANTPCNCAPPMPPTVWSVDTKGVATAREDQRAAAIFERAMKTRLPIISVKASLSVDGTRIEVGINVPSLVHRARSRLARFEACSTAWRLVSDHAELAHDPSSVKFRLNSNSSDVPYDGPLSLQYALGDAQKKSLAWMRSQEIGVPWTITEVEEEVHPQLGWRVEARAAAKVTIRGGVLADLPSFGKTVTTIALIQSEFQQKEPVDIVQENQQPSPGLIDVAATLIVCPPHIAKQWRDELQCFLGKQQYAQYEIITIERFDHLQRLKIEDIQKARVIIVSWRVFAQDSYISQLSRLAGMPEPASTKGRAFDAWLNHVVKEVPDRVTELQAVGVSTFNKNTQDTLKARLEHPDFKAAVPLKIRHGSSYESYITKPKSKCNTSYTKPTITKTLPATKRTTVDWTSYQTPVLQMFRFNRLVVDEYHYLCEGDPKNYPAYASVKKFAAHKRWVLSGTPALGNFFNVNQIASLLGTTLGRDLLGDGKGKSPVEKRIISDQTVVEKFLSRTELKSSHWHKSRHQQAQEFLNRFCRQNEPQLGHIACTEVLCPLELGAAHHAVYLELSQHLIAQRMQMKRLNSRSQSDRIDRLNTSLNNSATAEEALLKSALIFELKQGSSGEANGSDSANAPKSQAPRSSVNEEGASPIPSCGNPEEWPAIDHLTQKRKEQLTGTEMELLDLLKTAEKYRRHLKSFHNHYIDDHYSGFKKDVTTGNVFGDEQASKTTRRLILIAEGSGAKRLNVTSEECLKKLKTLASNLRSSAQELTLRIRSLRFIESIKQILSSSSKKSPVLSCSSSSCSGTASVSQLYLVSQCGHRVCESCLDARTDNESCVHEDCDAPVLTSSLIKASDLGSAENEAAGTSYGKKLDAISTLIQQMPQEDQAIVFVPNEDIMSIVEAVFEESEIEFHAVSKDKASSAEKIEDFQKNTDPEDRKKVLILNLKDESAAGVNLVNANHVVFVSPLLAESQYKYDSAMAQAIARSRRYGQTKRVFIHHFAALRTIDVDILEHRHKRFNALDDQGIRTYSHSTGGMKQKTKMVRNSAGAILLIPITWLADDGICEDLKIDAKDPGAFTSLINFSETFEDDDE